MELTDLTITQVHEGLKKKDFSAFELCQTYLDKIKEKNKEIFAFLTINENLALSKAKEVDDMILAGKEIPILAGVPSAIKDNILVEDISCSAGSKILENYIAPYDATVIRKLKNQKAIILGKTNLDEFAMGSSTENSAFGPTHNPHDLTRVPGGSSGGSAAAVDGGLSVFALGSDTGGSIRQPSSFCGVVGLKPTFGAVSRYGLIAFASSLDQIGPITKTVEDCQIVFDVIKGKDELDSTSLGSKLKSESLNLKSLKIGIPKEYFIKGIDPKVEKVIKKAIKKYEEMGAKIKEISLPHTEYALPCYYIIALAEASANLARYDGIKYGYSKTELPKEAKVEKSAKKVKFLLPPSLSLGSAKKNFSSFVESRDSGTKIKKRFISSTVSSATQRTKFSSTVKSQKSKVKSLLDVYSESRGEGFGAEVRRRIILGTYVLSAGYYEAYYLRAQKVRTLIKNDFEKVFKEVDVIFAPVSPFLPFKIGERIKDPLSMYLVDIYTVSVNLVGVPALSLPIGRVDNLPVGLQIIGKPFEEDKILEIGKLYAAN